MRTAIFCSCLFLSLLLLSACAQKDRYKPSEFLSEKEQADFIRSTVYYTAKVPPNANQETKFSKEFDEYYDLAARETDLARYYIAEGETHYFLLTRVARSITPMREAIGGKIKYDQNKNITEYEEIFRTWKQPQDTTLARGSRLFNIMVRGGDLTPYYSNIQGDKYIEFPDSRFYFDKIKRRWRDKELDSLQISFE